MKKEKILNLFVGSNNQGKIKEIRDLLPKKVEIITPKDLNLKSPIEDGKTFEENSFLVNKGVSGQTSIEMLSRFQEDVIKQSPKAVYILAGINDIAQNSGYISIDDF